MTGYLSRIDWKNAFGRIFRALGNSLEEPEERNALLKSSYLHPNGFMKISLTNVRLEQGAEAVRIHYWGEPVITNLHSHRWDMSVKLILGGYVSTDFVEDPAGIAMDRYTCSANDAGRYDLSTADIAHVRVERIRSISSGESYAQSAGIIHQVAKRDPGPTISLVACSAPVSEASAVFVPLGEYPRDSEGAPVQDSFLREVVKQTMSALERAS
jgi:hypothetical protein